MNISKFFLYLLWWMIPTPVFCQTKELDRLADDAAKATRRGNFALADSLYGEYVRLFREQELEKNFQYSEILIYLAQRAAQNGHPDEAIEIQKEVIEVRETAPDCTYLQAATATSDLARLYGQKGDYDNAIETGQEAMKMFRKKVGTGHHYFHIAVANQAAFYSARGHQGDVESAVALGEAAVKNMKKNTPEYAGALNSLVVYYSQAGDKLSALKIAQEARLAAKKWLKRDGGQYATTLNNHAIQLAKIGNYEAAIAYARDAKEAFEQAGNTNTLSYGKLLNNMAMFLSHLQNYLEASQLLEKAMPIIEKVVGKNHPDYLRCMSDLSAVYKANGDLARADELANESSKMSVPITANDNDKYARSLSRQAAVFASNGNYLRAIETEQKAYNYFKEREDMLSMAQSLGRLATYFANDNRLPTAFETAKLSLDIFREIGKKTTFYAQALNNTAIIYFNGEQYPTATDYGRQAREMYEELGDTTTAIYARILANNALFYYVNDSLEQAIITAEQALMLQKEVLGEDHPDHVPLLYNLSVFYSKAGKKTEAEEQFRQAMEMQSVLIRSSFLHLTSQEREKFWQKKSYVFKYAPMQAYLDPENKDITSMAYNSLLFTKGILLNSDIDFRSLLKQSENQELLAKYNQLEALQQQVESYYRLSANQRNIDLKKIKDDIYQLERTLVRECKEYGSFTESLSIDARQVSQKLSDDEAAIEFADIFIKGRGTTYLAFIIRKDLPEPKLIRLFSDDELRDLKYGKIDLLEAVQTQYGIDSVYNDRRFGKKLWQPLMKELAGVRRIYFSPTSLFYQLGIEYLPCDADHHIGDLYELYRISSTKLLARRDNAPVPIKSATVYGGLNYDMNLSQLEEQHSLHQAANQAPLLAMATVDTRRTLDSLAMRGSVGYLPGTLHEAENVGEQLMQNDIETNMLLGNEGTEESFKALSGCQQSIIHIATHGFYFSESDLKRRNQRLVFLNEQTENIDNPLNYSGLLMSGANYVLKGGKLPDKLEDGVLTANEIAQTDLSKTDLVVLSACQTGVGDIREDGVFGIQRGFKKAGAKSLLMSLWSVSDEATDLMMTKFYENLMAGKSKQQAFVAAQESLRKGKYAAPYFWASFILLDGF